MCGWQVREDGIVVPEIRITSNARNCLKVGVRTNKMGAMLCSDCSFRSHDRPGNPFLNRNCTVRTTVIPRIPKLSNLTPRRNLPSLGIFPVPSFLASRFMRLVGKHFPNAHNVTRPRVRLIAPVSSRTPSTFEGTSRPE